MLDLAQRLGLAPVEMIRHGWKTSPLVLGTRARRCVRLGDRDADFQLADDAPFVVAEHSVRALRRGDADLSDLDASTMQWIRRTQSAPAFGDSDSEVVFDVDLAGRTWLTVRPGLEYVTVVGRRPIPKGWA